MPMEWKILELMFLFLVQSHFGFIWPVVIWLLPLTHISAFCLVSLLSKSLLMFMLNLPSAGSVQEYKLSSSTNLVADAKDIIWSASLLSFEHLSCKPEECASSNLELLAVSNAINPVSGEASAGDGTAGAILSTRGGKGPLNSSRKCSVLLEWLQICFPSASCSTCYTWPCQH